MNPEFQLPYSNISYGSQILIIIMMIKTARAINSNQASQTDKWYRVGTRREREKKVLNLITKVKELNSIEYRSMTEGTLDVQTEWKL